MLWKSFYVRVQLRTIFCIRFNIPYIIGKGLCYPAVWNTSLHTFHVRSKAYRTKPKVTLSDSFPKHAEIFIYQLLSQMSMADGVLDGFLP